MSDQQTDYPPKASGMTPERARDAAVTTVAAEAKKPAEDTKKPVEARTKSA